MAYMRACLQRDNHPADPFVLAQFRQLGWCSQDPEAQQHVWHNLAHYLATLERPPPATGAGRSGR